MFDGMFDVRIATSSNIIDKIRKLQTKMAAKEVAMVVILSELADSDDEKPTRGPTRSWIKRRKENGFFETIIKELILKIWRDLKKCSAWAMQMVFKPSFPFSLAQFLITGGIISSVRHIQR